MSCRATEMADLEALAEVADIAQRRATRENHAILRKEKANDRAKANETATDQTESEARVAAALPRKAEASSRQLGLRDVVVAHLIGFVIGAVFVGALAVLLGFAGRFLVHAA